MSEFPNRLKMLRESKNISLLKLSKKLNISDATLCRWENGVVDVKGESLIVLAKYFNVTTDYLLGLED